MADIVSITNTDGVTYNLKDGSIKSYASIKVGATTLEAGRNDNLELAAGENVSIEATAILTAADVKNTILRDCLTRYEITIVENDALDNFCSFCVNNPSYTLFTYVSNQSNPFEVQYRLSNSYYANGTDDYHFNTYGSLTIASTYTIWQGYTGTNQNKQNCTLLDTVNNFVTIIPKVTINSTDTTYSDATTSAAGLMSDTDKLKLDDISEGANKVESSTTNGKIKIDGTETTVYDDSNVKAASLAKNDTVLSTDKTPFLFRPIPPFSTPYIREKLVGASMAWNQLVENGNFANNHLSGTGWEKNSSISWSVANGVVSLTFAAGTSNNRFTHQLATVTGRKYLICSTVKSDDTTNLTDITVALTAKGNISDSDPVYAIDGNFKTIQKVVEATADNMYISHGRKHTYSVAVTLEVKNVYVIDLTLAFGTAIADRIYAMEQATAGSGIAWIKSYGFLTDDYYANDAGSIQSVCVDRKEIVGFNLFDKDAPRTNKDGTSSVDGTKITVNCTYYTRFECNLLPGEYYVGFTYVSASSRAGKLRFIYNDESTSDYLDSGTIVNTSKGIKAILLYSGGGTANQIVFDHVCVNLSDTASNGTYEPYHKTTISLGHDTLRGVMQLDANNNLVYYGDEKTNNGVIDRKFGEYTFTGEETWLTYGSGYRAVVLGSAPYKTISDSTIPTDCITDCNLEFKSRGNINNGVVGISMTNDTIIVSDYSNLQGKKLIYPLATPTTEQSTPFTSPQYLFDGGTEEFIDYGVEQETRDVAVPVGHVTEYLGASDGTEIKDKFYLPALPSSDGEYKLTAKIQNGVLTEAKWKNENLIDDTTQVQYKLGINNGLLYAEEV